MKNLLIILLLVIPFFCSAQIIKNKKVQQLEERVINLELQNRDLNQKSKSYSEKIESLENDIEVKNSELQKSKQENENLKNNITMYGDQQVLVDSILILNKDLKSIIRKYTDQYEETSACEDKKSKLETAVQNLKQEKAFILKEHQELKKDYRSASKLKDEINSNNQELSNLKNKIENLTKEKESTLQDLKNIRKENEKNLLIKNQFIEAYDREVRKNAALINEIFLYDKNYSYNKQDKKENIEQSTYRLKLNQEFYEEEEGLELEFENVVKIDLENGKILYFIGKFKNTEEANQSKKILMQDYGYQSEIVKVK